MSPLAIEDEGSMKHAPDGRTDLDCRCGSSQRALKVLDFAGRECDQRPIGTMILLLGAFEGYISSTVQTFTLNQRLTFIFTSLL